MPSSTKVALIEASKKVNETVVFINIREKRQKQKPNFILGDSVGISDNRSVLSKGDTANYSNELYTINQVLHENMPSYLSNYLPKRFNENLLLPTKLTLDEKNREKLNLIQ